MTGATIFGWLFIVIGGALLAGVGTLYAIARRAITWPSGEGRVLAAWWDTDAAVSAYRRNRRLRVTYEYEVAGQKFTGTRIAFGDSLFGWLRTRSDDAIPYTVGQAVIVSYDPGHPERCTLTRVPDARRFTQVLIVAAIFFVAGIAALNGVIHVRT